jgi:hypothetical protein
MISWPVFCSKRLREYGFRVAIGRNGFAISDAVGSGDPPKNRPAAQPHDLNGAKTALPTGRDLVMNPGAGLVEPYWLFPRELCGLILHCGLLSPSSEAAERVAHLLGGYGHVTPCTQQQTSER